MEKYIFKFKKEVLLSYLNREVRYKFLADKYGIAVYSKIKQQIKA